MSKITVVDQSQVIKPREPIALDRASTSRLITHIKTCMVELGESLLFEPNDKITRDSITGISNYMDVLMEARAIADYSVVCNETNNPPNVIDANELHAELSIKLANSCEFIHIPLHLVSASYDDTIERFDEAMKVVFG